MCDMLAPCVKKDVFPDDVERDDWEAECNAYPVNTYYKCSSVFEDDQIVNDDGFRAGFGVSASNNGVTHSIEHQQLRKLAMLHATQRSFRSAPTWSSVSLYTGNAHSNSGMIGHTHIKWIQSKI